MTNTRTRIEDAVRATPGIHFNGLVRSLDLATGQVQYHLKQLLATDEIVATELYGRTHYYPREVDGADRRTIALLRRETTREIVALIFGRDTARPGAIAHDLGIARSTLEWHLDRLIEQGLVVKRRGDGNRVTLDLTDPIRTIELVREVDPSLLEERVSGYTGLVEGRLFEPAEP